MRGARRALGVPLDRRGDKLAVAVAACDVGQHHGRQLARLVQRLAAAVHDAVVFEIAEHLLQPDAVAALDAEGARDLALADLAGGLGDEGEDLVAARAAAWCRQNRPCSRPGRVPRPCATSRIWRLSCSPRPSRMAPGAMPPPPARACPARHYGIRPTGLSDARRPVRFRTARRPDRAAPRSEPRDAARMLVVRPERRFEDRIVRDLPDLLQPGDVLVLNDTKVIPSRLYGLRMRGTRRRVSRSCCTSARAPTAGAPSRARPRSCDRRPHPLRRRRSESTACELVRLDAEVEEKGRGGRGGAALLVLRRLCSTRPSRGSGNCPCRPTSPASVRPTTRTAPTTRPSMPGTRAPSPRRPPACISPTRIVRRLDERGVGRHFVTLHVGAGTFLPVKADDTASTGCMRNGATSTPETAAALNAARAAEGGSSRSAPRRCGCWRAPRARTARAPLRGRDRDLHHARLPLQGGRRADDQLPPAALDPVHAGLRLCRAGAHETAPMPMPSRRAIASTPMAMRGCCSAPHRRTPVTPINETSIAAVHASSFSFTVEDRRRARTGADPHAARRHPHAGLHAGRHGRHREGDVSRSGEGARRRRGARQHLSPDAAARRRAGGAARRPAHFHELALSRSSPIPAASR